MKAKIYSGVAPDYLTVGKEYDVLDQWKSPNGSVGFTIVEDTGQMIFCLEKGCAHLFDGIVNIDDCIWELTEE